MLDVHPESAQPCVLPTLAIVLTALAGKRHLAMSFEIPATLGLTITRRCTVCGRCLHSQWFARHQPCSLLAVSAILRPW